MELRVLRYFLAVAQRKAFHGPLTNHISLVANTRGN